MDEALLFAVWTVVLAAMILRSRPASEELLLWAELVGWVALFAGMIAVGASLVGDEHLAADEDVVAALMAFWSSQLGVIGDTTRPAHIAGGARSIWLPLVVLCLMYVLTALALARVTDSYVGLVEAVLALGFVRLSRNRTAAGPNDSGNQAHR